jgi:hypothetical protein
MNLFDIIKNIIQEMKEKTKKIISQQIEFNNCNLLEIYEKQNFESIKRYLNPEFIENSNFHFFLKSLIVKHIPTLSNHSNKLGNLMRFFTELKKFYSKENLEKFFKFENISDKIIDELQGIQPENYENLHQQFSLFLHSGSLIDVSFMTKKVLGVFLNCDDEIQKRNISQFLILLFEKFENFFDISSLLKIYKQILKLNLNSIAFTMIISKLKFKIDWNFIFNDELVCKFILPFDEKLTILFNSKSFEIPRNLRIRMNFFKLILKNDPLFLNWWNLSEKFKSQDSLELMVNTVNLEGLEYPNFRKFMEYVVEDFNSVRFFINFHLFEIVRDFYFPLELKSNENLIEQFFVIFYELKLENRDYMYLRLILTYRFPVDYFTIMKQISIMNGKNPLWFFKALQSLKEINYEILGNCIQTISIYSRMFPENEEIALNLFSNFKSNDKHKILENCDELVKNLLYWCLEFQFHSIISMLNPKEKILKSLIFTELKF